MNREKVTFSSKKRIFKTELVLSEHNLRLYGNTLKTIDCTGRS